MMNTAQKLHALLTRLLDPVEGELPVAALSAADVNRILDWKAKHDARPTFCRRADGHGCVTRDDCDDGPPLDTRRSAARVGRATALSEVRNVLLTAHPLALESIAHITDEPPEGWR